jgi:hypothetical protein
VGFCHDGLTSPEEDEQTNEASVIMKNNGISDILTFDEKDDFKQMPDLTVLHPRDVKI